MASLSIGVDVRGGEGARAPGMVAELERVGAGGRQRRTVAVATGDQTVVDDVDPGLWEIRLVMPAGRTLVREVEVRDGSQASAEFDISVRAARGDRAAYLPPPSSGSASNGIVARGSAALRDLAIAGGTRFSGIVGRPNRMLREVDARIVPVQGAGDPAAAPPAWRAMAAALRDGGLPVSLWSAGREVEPERRGEDVDGARLWEVRGAEGERTFALVGGRGRRRLHSVPTPWWRHGQGPDAFVAVGGEAASNRSRIAITDPSFAGLVSYLSHGAIVTAVELIDADRSLGDRGGTYAENLLADKRSSPLGACAAAYALVGTTRPREDAHWHAWVGNLRRWFEWVPDGAILDARLQLLRARTEADVEAVLPLVQQAVSRGVPYYRQGFDWLLQAMRQFPDDPVLAEALPAVSAVSAYLDMADVFTTFELDRDW